MSDTTMTHTVETSAQGGCSIKPVLPGKPRKVSVNGIEIERARIAVETQNHKAEKPHLAIEAAARALVIRELLLQRARELGLAAAPQSDGEGRRETDDEALVRQVVETEVRTPTASAAECRRFYDGNAARFKSPSLHHVSHILLAASALDAEGRAAAIRTAAALIAELQTDPSRFAALAAAHSDCPSGKQGGNLGQIGPGQTVPEFEAALAHAPLGTVAPRAVESRYGLHIVLVERRIDGRQLPFEMVAARIADWLEEKVRRTAIRQYIAMLAGRATIEGVTLDAASSPLVQ
ncbi:MAG: peptidylprolyl isomerase [Rhizobiaceae bacterium]|nr:peptidylprolyl isomerase [Rhizobiaceae bacterium]